MVARGLRGSQGPMGQRGTADDDSRDHDSRDAARDAPAGRIQDGTQDVANGEPAQRIHDEADMTWSPDDLVTLRPWAMPVTVAISTGAGILALAGTGLILYGGRWSADSVIQLVLARLIAFAVVVALLAAVGFGRSGKQVVRDANPFWPGVFVGTLVVVGTVVADVALQFVRFSTDLPTDLPMALMTSVVISAFSFEFVAVPFAGGITWAFATGSLGGRRR